MSAALPVRVLVAGYSTRAIADSAARAGFDVTAIDAFADLDQHPAVNAIAVPHFNPQAASAVARQVTCDAVVYSSGFENHPDAVRALAHGRQLWGNSPEALVAARNPLTLAECFSHQGLGAPRLDGDGDGPWLMKPLASGGGNGVARWNRGTPVPAGFYLQEFIEGEPGSIAFVAAGGQVRVLGLFRQLVGLDAFGAAGFRYCGSLLENSIGSQSWMLRAGAALARAVSTQFNLVGVNGIDFIARGGILYPVEVNPRWSASMELVERAHDFSVFAAHATACTAGALPDIDAMTAPPIGRTIGKAVIFARQDVNIGDTSSWCEDASVRDIPRPGTFIHAGQPVCTVFGDGATQATCLGALEARAAQVFDVLRGWAERT